MMNDNSMSDNPMREKRMLLHMCCAPCAGIPSRILQEEGFSLTGFWHSPNIHPREEWELRRSSVEALAVLREMPMIWSDDFRQQEWADRFTKDLFTKDRFSTDKMTDNSADNLTDNSTYNSMNKINTRCAYCHDIRMDTTAKMAMENGIPYFTTSLTISPYQNHEAIQEAGERAAQRYGVTFLYRDFRPFYREGINLARAQGWYVQKYCGCMFSHAESDHPRKPAYLFES